VHYFDQVIAYLSIHWWLAGAVIVWIGALIAGLQIAFDHWTYRRILRRTAELRKEKMKG
jgi:hypothetical protein